MPAVGPGRDGDGARSVVRSRRPDGESGAAVAVGRRRCEVGERARGPEVVVRLWGDAEVGLAEALAGQAVRDVRVVDVDDPRAGQPAGRRASGADDEIGVAVGVDVGRTEDDVVAGGRRRAGGRVRRRCCTGSRHTGEDEQQRGVHSHELSHHVCTRSVDGAGSITRLGCVSCVRLSGCGQLRAFRRRRRCARRRCPSPGAG